MWLRRALALVVALVLSATVSAAVAAAAAGASPARSGAISFAYDTPSAATTAPPNNTRIDAHEGERTAANGSRRFTRAHAPRRAAKGGRVLPRMAGGAPLPEETVRPGGSLIGRAGRSPGIREVDNPGEVDDLFDQIRIHGTPTKSTYGGERYDLPGGGFVGRRISGKYGPTLDLNLPGVDDAFKVHVRH